MERGSGPYSRHGDLASLIASRTYAPSGEPLTFTAVLQNNTGSPLTFDLSLPLPQHTAYAAHSAGAFEAGALHWNGDVPANSQETVALYVTVLDSARLGDTISATAEFSVKGVAFAKSVSLAVGWRSYLPAVTRRHVAAASQ